jgi:hypothetical protein
MPVLAITAATDGGKSTPIIASVSLTTPDRISNRRVTNAAVNKRLPDKSIPVESAA